MFVHEKNIDTKIKNNYGGFSDEISSFKNTEYLRMRREIESVDFTDGKEAFKKAVDTLNKYWVHLHSFAIKYNIKSQSKFESSFLEEISYYLFKNHTLIRNDKLNIFNKGIYAGLKINEDLSIDIIKKDVDFCIGKKIDLTINTQSPVQLIIPAVSVEVKTYLDATMFGEVKSSSKTLKSSTPNSKAYVLMGYKCLSDEHILAARQDSTLDGMFALQEKENSPINVDALYEYYKEICEALDNIAETPEIITPGRLL